MTDLKKCPFCGGEAKIVRDNSIVNYPQYQVRCKNISCTIRPKTNWGSDRQEIIGHWNNRVTEAEIRAKAIDEFAEKFIYKAVCEGCSFCCICYNEDRQSECEDWKSYIEIAEQLKDGAV